MSALAEANMNRRQVLYSTNLYSDEPSTAFLDEASSFPNDYELSQEVLQGSQVM
jgi:hypothetical protein